MLVSRFAFSFDGRSRSPVSSDLSAHRLLQHRLLQDRLWQDRLWHTFSFIDSEQLAHGLDGDSLCIFRVEEFKVIRSQRDDLCLNWFLSLVHVLDWVRCWVDFLLDLSSKGFKE